MSATGRASLGPAAAVVRRSRQGRARPPLCGASARLSSVSDPVDRRVRVQGVPVDGYPPLAPEAERGAVRRVTVVGEEILARPCREVTEFGTRELSSLIDDMFLTMHVAHGAGLATNQVDVGPRLFVMTERREDVLARRAARTAALARATADPTA